MGHIKIEVPWKRMPEVSDTVQVWAHWPECVRIVITNPAHPGFPDSRQDLGIINITSEQWRQIVAYVGDMEQP